MDSRWIFLCVLALSLVPSPGVVASYGFPDVRQAEFVKSLKDYQIDVPQKVKENGEFLSHMLHHDLQRRDTQQQVHYEVKVDSNTLHLSLKPNNRLVAPGMVVERRNYRYGNVTDTKLLQKGYNPCHFIGKVKGDASSKVAISTCGGLNGVIMTRDGHYFIEQVRGHNTTDDQHQPHLIYKHQHLPSTHHHHDDNRDNYCGSDSPSGVDDEKQREKWEKHVRKNYASHHRHKRSYSLERKVETLVVVDPKMVHYYKDEDIETYVLTIMNMVATMYHDASIGNAVNVVLVRVMLLEEDEEFPQILAELKKKELKISHHADNTLKSFCAWQKNINPKEDSHPNHHDVAVLLTRYNICSRMNQPCSTLGLAQVSGMCQPHRSCNVNEDTGLALAYTVAHEIGHNFGMKHDSYINGCMHRDGDRRYVMSPQLHVDTSPLIWSNCSRADITKFLDRDWGFCLEDEPADHEFEFPVLPPGVMYDADHQCRLQYGPDAEYCDGIESICKTLWCRVDNKCMTRVEAAAEGTLCEEEDYYNTVSKYTLTPKKWCFAGECVTIGDRPESINGEWSQWGSWSECTRSCGSGITYAERLCDNPPPSNGGKYCLGERKRFRICDTDPCPEGFTSFHDQQCEEFNYIPYKNGLYEWEHVPTPDTPCQLHCKPVNRFFHVMLKDIVTDGTPCQTGTRNMCISGRCRHVGCDWVIDSDAKEDRCGVCHGDGRACKTVKAQFKGQQGLGYVEATIIPTGARNIRIEEVAEANNYIALRNDRGEYLLNGHWFIQWSGDYDAAGSKVHYERNGNKERLFSLGPLKEPLHVMLLFQSHNPGVQFEYTVPNENATEARPPIFAWKFSEWTHCTSSCGGGTQQSIVVCTEMEAGVIDNNYCLAFNMTKPDDKLRSCNTHLCPARWWAGPWQHCSVTCGRNGIHKRTVICVRSFGPDHQIALEDHECENQEKPKEYELCHHKDACPDEVYWETADWSECTRSCGGGIQFREVRCVGDTTCPGVEQPGSERICNLFDCDEMTADINATQVIIPDNDVNSTSNNSNEAYYKSKLNEKDSSMREKILSPGPGRDSDDQSGKEWSSSEADSLTRYGPAPKSGVDHDNDQDVSSKHLSKSKKRVGSSRNQNRNKSNDSLSSILEDTLLGDLHKSTAIGNVYDSTLIEEDKESFSFDMDIKEGTFSKVLPDRALEGSTVGHPTLQDKSPIVLTNIAHQRDQDYMGSDHVSNVVKTDTKSEQVEKEDTADSSDSHLESAGPSIITTSSSSTNTSSNAAHTNKSLPMKTSGLHVNKTLKTSTSQPLFNWLPLFWQACNKQCGGGVRQRKLMCMSRTTLHEVPATNCENIPRITTEEKCNDQPCVGWQATSWSECSKSCNNGTRHRQVLCPVQHMCDHIDKPATQQVCNAHRCLGWIAGPWSKCSKTCSGGEQARHVQCIDLVTDQPATGCDSLSIPNESQKCNTEPCEVENAALQDRFGKPDTSEHCVMDRMRHSICLQLKHKGQCAHRYIAMQCCRTCMLHRKHGKGKNMSRR